MEWLSVDAAEVVVADGTSTLHDRPLRSDFFLRLAGVTVVTVVAAVVEAVVEEVAGEVVEEVVYVFPCHS